MNDRRATTVAVVATLVVVTIVAVGTAAALHRGPWAPPTPDAPPPEDLGPVIAEVNGTPIYLADARSRIDGIVTVHGDVADALGPDWQDVIFQSLVDDQLLSQEAEQLGIDVTEDDMQTWYEQIEGSIGSSQTLDQWLQTQGMTRQEMDRTIVRQIIGTRVFVAVTEEVTVTDDELREYYRAHRADYAAPDGTTVPFPNVRESIREQLEEDRQSAAYASWLEERRQAATVTVLLRDWWKDLT